MVDGNTNMNVSVFETFTLYRKQAQTQKNTIKYGKSKTTLCITCYEGIVYLKVTFSSLHGAKLGPSTQAFCSLGDRRALEWVRPRALFSRSVFGQKSHEEGIADLC